MCKSLVTLLLLAPTPMLAETQLSKPNIVVFLADDMGWGDSATYGHPLIKTPNLDKLASQGVKFTQCYSACGVCSPSRSAILTGRTPYRNGVYRHLSGLHEAHLRSSEITYPKLLKTTRSRVTRIRTTSFVTENRLVNSRASQRHWLPPKRRAG